MSLRDTAKPKRRALNYKLNEATNVESDKNRSNVRNEVRVNISELIKRILSEDE